MESEALCQDCLRIQLVEVRPDWTGEEECLCGGDLCCCSGCSRCIQQLRAGERSADTLGLLRGDIRFWSEERGRLCTK